MNNSIQRYMPQRITVDNIEWINSNIPGRTFSERITNLIQETKDWSPKYGLGKDLKKMFGVKNGRKP